jgi:hypothetical protein
MRKENERTLVIWWDFSGNVSIEVNMEWKFEKIARKGSVRQLGFQLTRHILIENPHPLPPPFISKLKILLPQSITIAI